ncbi:MAG TPA: hypothetical protein VEK08_20665 [Planctomycetota bacterium]|nr:hypothetical protein [Planctomycetota bacterium]
MSNLIGNVIVTLVVIGLAGLATSFLARWMLRPLLDEVDPKARTQFTIYDIYVLVVQMALPGLLLAKSRISDYEQTAFFAILASTWALLGVLWLIGVGMLSRAGVQQIIPRAISLFVTIPAAYVMAFIFSFLILPSLFSPPFMGMLIIAFLIWSAVTRILADWARLSAPLRFPTYDARE